MAAVARGRLPILGIATAVAFTVALLVVATAVAFGGPALRAALPHRPLAGKTVGIDPGHNGGNFSAPSVINAPVWNGREEEACDTTGTETNAGYTEARFNFNVATYLRRDLEAEGAKVVMTRRTNNGVGPCIDRRAKILDKARSDVAIDIHADGGPPAAAASPSSPPSPTAPTTT